jgi:hypothetical protein
LRSLVRQADGPAGVVAEAGLDGAALEADDDAPDAMVVVAEPLVLAGVLPPQPLSPIARPDRRTTCAARRIGCMQPVFDISHPECRVADRVLGTAADRQPLD